MPQQINEDQVKNLTTDLAAKAPLASPGLTGIPTAPTATAGTNTTQIATTAFVEAAIAGGTSGITQLTGDVTAGPGSGSQAATVVATHLSAPLPIAQGGTGTATPGIVAGANVTVSGTWPNQTIASSGSGGGAGQAVYTGNSASASTTTGGPITATFGSSVAAGNGLLVILEQGGPTLTVSSLQDSHGNNGVLVAQYHTGTTPFYDVYVFPNTPGGATSITCTFTQTNNQLGMFCMEYTNLVGVSLLDGTPQATSANSGNLTTAPVVTSNPNDLLVAIASINHGTGWASNWSAGFTQRATASGLADGDWLWVADQNVSAVGSYAVTWTNNNTGGSNVSALLLLALKVGGGVTAFKGRSGQVLPAANDYDFSQLSGTAAASQLPAMIASGPTHAQGAVPDPGAVAGATRFLREDAVWAVPSGGGSSFGDGELTFTTPILSNFSSLNFNGTSSGTNGNGIYLTDNGLIGNADTVRALVTPITTPASAWTATARIRSSSFMPTFLTLGMVLYDSVGGKVIVYGFSNPVGPLGLINMNGVNSWNSQTNLGAGWISNVDSWLRVKFDGTNLNYYWSRDGNFWWFAGAAGVTAFLANRPNNIGIGMNANNNGGRASSSNPYNMQCFSWTLSQP